MKYVSTRGGGTPQSFEQVLLAGLAPDGGLYVPESWPQLDLAALKGKSYIEIAEEVMYPFVEGCIPRADFREILEQTYGPETFRDEAVTPLVRLNDNLLILEQFHGPTIAFKDVALQLLGRLFDYVLTKRGQRITIVGATSGDTGSAAIEGCRACANIDIFILHPEGRVSDVQRKQMTTVQAPGVHNIALEGNFDDCQNMVKAMFADEDFRRDMNLSAVNSINWARIMAQIVYYVTSALQLGAPEKDVSFIVPTGNFGNVFAAYAARQMGLPIKHLGISTNKNDILTRFFETGTMSASEVTPTLSPSMDIQISSNFERYLYFLLGRESEKLTAIMQKFKASGAFTLDESLMAAARAEFSAHRLDDEGTLAMIKDIYARYDYILDPHTAVGMAGALALQAQGAGGDIVVLATAHPAKFPDAVEKAIGLRPALPEHLSDLFTREEKMEELPNNMKTVQDFVAAHSRAAQKSAA
ncbi:MAG: threonine synthase [Alphaproteobacteria bacterium]|nr:threonine synthase [Alphaproteobacteria bacterium]